VRGAQLDGRWAVAGADIRPYASAARAALPSWCILLFERRGTKSFANDLVEDLGDVVTRAVVSKLFLIAYHLWDPYCHRAPPWSRKTQSAKYHSIESLENRNLDRCNKNKMAVRNYEGHF